MKSFPQEIHESIGHYVYRLIDPRNGETFYIGKGSKNRIFEHVNFSSSSSFKDDDEDEISLKIKRIYDIQLVGLEVLYVVHRHGIENKEIAFQIEAALIEAYSGLNTIQGGHYSSEYGIMSAQEIVNKYKAEEADFDGIKGICITVNNSIENGVELYYATKRAWRLDPNRAKQAKYVFAVVKGIIKGVYEPKRWASCIHDNFNDLQNEFPNRYGFDGKEACEDIKGKFLNKKVTRQRGASNPINYKNI